MSVQKGSISGGRKLRMIRERRGITQLALGLDEVITQANYSKIERGIATPTRPKLEAILDAFEATFNERQEVIASFGYPASYPLPELHEIEAICKKCQPVLDCVPMPAYLMDMVTRLLAWNTGFARLLGVHETSGVLEKLRYTPLFKAQFDSRVRLGKYVENNIETCLLAEAQSIRDRLAPYQGEPWYDGFIQTLCEDPEFHKYWQATRNATRREEIITEFAARTLEPVRFRVSVFDNIMHLNFYSNRDAVIGDNRFRVVYLIPADAFSIRQVQRWLAGA